MNLNTSFPLMIQMIISLGWRDILILHDDSIDTVFFPLLDMQNIISVNYDITSSADENLLTILTETHHLVQPVLLLLLLCDHTLAERVLQQMDTFDAVSRFSFDIRHSSRVLVVGNWRDLDAIVIRNTLVENIAVVEMPDVQCSDKRPLVWTLVFATHGRVLTPVSLPTWPTLKLSSVFPNSQYGYNGRQLTVVMKHYTFPHGNVTVGNRTLSRISYRTLEYMAQSLNFSPNIVYPREDEWGRDVEGSYTGVIGMLQRKEVDLAAEPLKINSGRKAVVDQVLPWLLENKMVIMYKMEEEEEEAEEGNLMVYLRPFQPVVYTALFVSLIIYSLLLCFERLLHKTQSERDIATAVYLDNTSMQKKDIRHVTDVSGQCASKICMTFLAAFQDGLMASLRQGLQATVSRTSERLLVSFWWIFTVIISSIYCGVILSCFAVRIQKPPFSNLAELARRQDYTIGYDSSSSISAYLKVSTKSDAILIVNRVRQAAVTDPDVLSSDINKHFDRLQQGKYAYFENHITALPKTRTSCMLKAIDVNFGTSDFTFAVPKQSPFKKAFEKSMYRLQDNGILQKIQDEWLRSIPEEKCDLAEFSHPISLAQLHSMFIVIGAGICCAAVMLLVEKIWAKVDTIVSVCLLVILELLASLSGNRN